MSSGTVQYTCEWIQYTLHGVLLEGVYWIRTVRCTQHSPWLCGPRVTPVDLSGHYEHGVLIALLVLSPRWLQPLNLRSQLSPAGS